MGNHGAAGGISERRHSSCSSFCYICFMRINISCRIHVNCFPVFFSVACLELEIWAMPWLSQCQNASEITLKDISNILDKIIISKFVHPVHALLKAWTGCTNLDMMKLWHGNALHINGPLWGESINHSGFLSRMVSDVELCCFLWC